MMVIVSGLPGSGKSYFASKLSKDNIGLLDLKNSKKNFEVKLMDTSPRSSNNDPISRIISNGKSSKCS